MAGGSFFWPTKRAPDDGHFLVGSTTRKALSAPLISGWCCCSGGSNLHSQFSKFLGGWTTTCVVLVAARRSSLFARRCDVMKNIWTASVGHQFVGNSRARRNTKKTQRFSEIYIYFEIRKQFKSKKISTQNLRHSRI